MQDLHLTSLHQGFQLGDDAALSAARSAGSQASRRASMRWRRAFFVLDHGVRSPGRPRVRGRATPPIRCSAGLRDQVPEVAVRITEHGHCSPWLALRFANELHAFRFHGGEVLREVVGMQKEEDTSTALAAIACSRCGVAARAREQTTSVSIPWERPDPALGLCPRTVSSTSVKPSFSVYQAIARS